MCRNGKKETFGMYTGRSQLLNKQRVLFLQYKQMEEIRKNVIQIGN